MDLKEINHYKASRHPWETARFKALYKILHSYLFNGINILDIGCGDGFISRNLFNNIREKNITAVDINLSDEQIVQLNKHSPDIRFLKNFPVQSNYDLLLLLDVLEHIEEDAVFLADLINRYANIGTKIIITVPAFQSIYGPHDINLGHYRRYRLADLEYLAFNQGLNVISSGYLFASLLLPKIILCNIFKSNNYSKGVGSWSGGRFKTGFFEKLLNIDNDFLLYMSRIGIKIPGLTGWLLCEKQG